jgi:P-type Ca2+ transporter type 2C
MTSGLTSAQAADRLKLEGPNELPAQDRRSALRILLEVVRQPMCALKSRWFNARHGQSA